MIAGTRSAGDTGTDHGKPRRTVWLYTAVIPTIGVTHVEVTHVGNEDYLSF